MVSKKIFLTAAFVFAVLFNMLAQQPRLVLPIGHTDKVSVVKFSPDNKLVLTASADHTTKLWDACTGLLLNSFLGHTSEIMAAEFSPDGRLIVTASADKTCILWEIYSGKILDKLENHSQYVNDVQFNKAGQNILTVSGDNTASVWKINSGFKCKLLFTIDQNEAVRTIPLEGDWMLKAKYTPDGNSIITYTEVGSAKIWNASNGKLKFTIGNNTFIKHLACSKDGKWIATDNVDQQDSAETAWSSKPGNLWIWNAATGKLKKQIKFPGGKIFNLNFSADSKKLAAFTNSKAFIFNTQNWSISSTLKVDADYNLPNQIAFNPDTLANEILTVGADQIARVWDLTTGLQKFKLGKTTEQISVIDYSDDGYKIISGSDTENGKIWDAMNGEQLFSLQLKNQVNPIHSIVISPADNFVLTVMDDGIINIWDATTLKLINAIPAYHKIDYNLTSEESLRKNNHPRITRFSMDEKFIITYQNNDTACIWEIASGKLICSFSKKGAIIKNYSDNAVTISEDKRIINIAVNNAVTRINIDELKLVRIPSTWYNDELTPLGVAPITGWKSAPVKRYKFEECYEGICLSPYLGESYIAFSNRHSWLATVTSSNTIDVLDTLSGKLLFRFFLLGTADYFAMIPSGYYSCASNAARQLHYLTSNLKVVSFDQLDVKYNRPDKVLQAIGSKNKNLIQSYTKAYEKRIRKLGIDADAVNGSYSVPEGDFANQEDITYGRIENTSSLRIHFKAIDKKFKLIRYNLWVNEVPVFGLRGLPLNVPAGEYFDTSFNITLSRGDNTIESSVTNSIGLESYRKPIFRKYNPVNSPKPNVYFIGIGINKFADSTHNLQWCIEDIRDLSKSLRDKYGNRLVVLDTLFDTKVTVANIKAVKEKLFRTTVNDIVILSYSGHGLLSKDYDYYLSTYPINFLSPESGGLIYDELENLFDSIPARKKLLLLDACHSGELDKEAMLKIEKSVSTLKSVKTTVNTGNRGGEVTSTIDNNEKLGLQNSFELMQSLFVNINKGTGAVVISAAGGVQFAQENSKLGHGVFTFSLIEALQKFNTVKVSELKKYIISCVLELTGGLQKPTVRNEPIVLDWDIW